MELKEQFNNITSKITGDNTPTKNWKNTLPKENMERCINEMQEGEIGWTVPWAVTFSPKAMIRGDYDLDNKQGGTIQLLVIQEKGKLYAILFDADHKYRMDEINPWKNDLCIPCNFMRWDQITETQLESFSPDTQDKLRALLR